MATTKVKTVGKAEQPKQVAPSIAQFGIVGIEMPPRSDGTSRDEELAQAHAAGMAMLDSLNRALPGDPQDTVRIARESPREYRDVAWQGAALRGTIERIVNVVIDHALNRQENLENLESYTRDVAARADDGEIATVQLAETLERLAAATEDAALAAAFAAGAWDFWTAKCGGEFRRFDNTYAAYRRRKMAEGADAKPAALDAQQQAMLARIKGTGKKA